MANGRITEEQLEEFMQVLRPIQKRLMKKYGVKKFRDVQEFNRKRRQRNMSFIDLEVL